MNKILKIKRFNGFYASENQNKRKIPTENKTHQDKNLEIKLCRIFSASKRSQDLRISATGRSCTQTI